METCRAPGAARLPQGDVNGERDMQTTSFVLLGGSDADLCSRPKQIFEIVLITENDAGSMVEMLNGVKGTEFVSKIVGNTAMRMQRGTMLKDLSIMNRWV